MNKQRSHMSIRQIPHTRLVDDGSLELRYEILNKLGKGSFGTVYRVQNKATAVFYAVKTIPKKLGNKSKSFSLDNEVKLLTEVNHPNLIRLHEVLESPQNLYLIIELCEGGELGGYVKSNGSLPEQTVKQIMTKLISALHYLHKIDVVHRDLKLENILLKNIPLSKTDEFDIRITDFGLSSKKSLTSADSLFNDYCGTPLYMAPEILENKNYSALCDVWAMGIIMFYLICGRHPYVAHDERRLLEIIRATTLRFDTERFRNLSSQGVDFLQGMLVYDTVHRRTMGELTVHPWLTGRSDKELNKDIITMMREFHAEDNHRQKTTEIDLTALINATAKHPKLSREDDNEPVVERKELNRQTSSRLDSNYGPDQVRLRMNQNATRSNLIDSCRNRTIHNTHSVNMIGLRTGTARLGRSRSQVDRSVSTKLPVPPRTALNGSNVISTSRSSVFNDRRTSTSTSSTITALMMINNQYSKASRTSSPFSNRQHAPRLSFYDKCPNTHV
ncbi:unnamed protein product [Adineta ricciae]|uniref:Protein kinase domain-containing protein n=1 Tax=Adineta ricciae TaxID=249248 RepID=A0A814NBX1_ADIRI|nr:unnamed protein product [Adineta ricciae]CAF1125806.1 unnamed protein product [Adineta ricciae]